MSIPSSGSSTSRSASTTSSLVGMAPRLLQPDFLAAVADEEVDAVDEPHPVAAGAHDERVRARAVGEVSDAAQQVAVRDAGGDDDHLARSELVAGEHARRVLDSGRAGLLDLAPRR